MDERNQSAADSLAEGLDETLTLHRRDARSVNALVEERCAKVDHWQSSSQRHRWLATALDIEPRKGEFPHFVPHRELKISKKQAA